jgi:poly-beta-1,6-N-acetyl-D-glucosamine synthase
MRPYRRPRVLARFVAGIDYIVPFVDVGYVFVWVPGMILSILGHPLIVSWWSMLVIPIMRVVFGVLRRRQLRSVLRRLHVRVEPDRWRFFGFLFVDQALTPTAALRRLRTAAGRHQAALEVDGSP